MTNRTRSGHSLYHRATSHSLEFNLIFVPKLYEMSAHGVKGVVGSILHGETH